MPFPLLTTQVGIFPTCKQPECPLGMLLVSFWFSTIIDCVYAQNYCNLLHLPLQAFCCLLALGGIVPCHHCRCSCFDASLLMQALLTSCSKQLAKLSFF